MASYSFSFSQFCCVFSLFGHFSVCLPHTRLNANTCSRMLVLCSVHFTTYRNRQNLNRNAMHACRVAPVHWNHLNYVISRWLNFNLRHFVRVWLEIGFNMTSLRDNEEYIALKALWKKWWTVPISNQNSKHLQLLLGQTEQQVLHFCVRKQTKRSSDGVVELDR